MSNLDEPKRYLAQVGREHSEKPLSASCLSGEAFSGCEARSPLDEAVGEG
jgi:hypothetical protein